MDETDLLSWRDTASHNKQGPLLGGEPAAYPSIMAETKRLGFEMAASPEIGRLLYALAASKPGGTILELGTGTGLSSAWLAHGLSLEAKLVSVDHDERVLSVARRFLGQTRGVTFCLADGAEFIGALEPMQLDLIFADSWPGKFSHLKETLSLLREGGFYVVDDLLPQATWPEGHQQKVDAFLAYMRERKDFAVTYLEWATGLLIATRIA